MPENMTPAMETDTTATRGQHFAKNCEVTETQKNSV